jgi:hypothetical protein
MLLRAPAEVTAIVNLSLFFITLPGMAKWKEAYKAQNGLTQCYNCQTFCYCWANSKQPPRCLWCWDNHLHRDRSSAPTCCNCQLAKGENSTSCQLPRLQACEGRVEKKERKLQRTPRTTTGKVFCLNFTTPAVLRSGAWSNAQQKKRPHQCQRSWDSNRKEASQSVSQSVRAPSGNGLPWDNTLRQVTVYSITWQSSVLLC